MRNASNHFWEATYPSSLQGYHLEPSSLAINASSISVDACARYGSRAAFGLVLPGGTSVAVSFDEVETMSDAFASYLVNDLGLGLGDVIAIQLPTSIHYPIAVLGAWKAGLIVTNINPLYTERELRHQLVDSGAKLLLASDLFLQVSLPVAKSLGLRLMTASLWDFFPEPMSAAVRTVLTAKGHVIPDIPFTRMADCIEAGMVSGEYVLRHHPIALYQYTGGTTGRSKGAVITHQNILSTVKMTRDFLDAHDGPIAGETMLTVLPMYHIFAFVVNFLVFFAAGTRNLLIPNPRPVSQLQSAFEHFQIEWMSGVDTLYAGLLAEPWFKARPPKMRYAFSGGTALRASTAEAWRAAVCPILEGYGMTETTCIVSVDPPTPNPRQGTVGVPLPGCEVRVVDVNGNSLGPGERGELVVKGPQVTSGYLHATEETFNAIVDGWLHTGDIAQFEPDGYLRIVDRKKDMILVSGFNVYPNEVEDVLASHPAILEAAVVGVADPVTGEAVRAFVVLKDPGVTEAEIERYCRTQLTAYKVPKQILFREQLPKSPVGKILRAQLRTV